MNNRVNAVVTGATKGIGKAIVEKLLSEGCNVTFCARNDADLQAFQADLQYKYPDQQISILATDVGDAHSLRLFGEYVLASMKTVDLLVNNAGIFLPGNLSTEPEGHLLTMLNVNLLSAYRLTKQLIPFLSKKGAHIFNICSVASLSAYPAGPSYSISKYAMLGFNDNLRVELAPLGVKVTAICPGPTYSHSWEGSGVEVASIMKASDIAEVLWQNFNLSPVANVDRIVLTPR